MSSRAGSKVVYRDEKAKKEWLAHVGRTPRSMVPVLINGQVPAYQSAMGTDFTGSKILRWFEPFPRRYWPAWALDESRRQRNAEDGS